MKIRKSDLEILQLILAMCLLFAGLFFGVMAAHSYTQPGFWKSSLGFIKLRPMHVSAVVFWILLASQALVNLSMARIFPAENYPVLSGIRLGLIILSILGIFFHYFIAEFGGREYLEFPPYLALLLISAWTLQLIGIVSRITQLLKQPVYIWMWISGSVFLLLTFLEHYSWLLPMVKKTTITDLTIQWKSAGSMVGSWNQLIYGLSIYLMTRLTGNEKPAGSRTARLLFLLGITNLMFNWGHHIYTLPAARIVQYISYNISMTEWLLLWRILYYWRKESQQLVSYKNNLTMLFLRSADQWLLLNLFLALLMSIPALNIFTHGTQITMAHSMGTTIGINTMILFGGVLYLAESGLSDRAKRWIRISFKLIQISLLVFFISLIISGIQRGFWQMKWTQKPFSQMMHDNIPIYRVFVYSGSALLFGFWICLWFLIRSVSRLFCKNISEIQHFSDTSQ